MCVCVFLGVVCVFLFLFLFLFFCVFSCCLVLVFAFFLLSVLPVFLEVSFVWVLVLIDKCLLELFWGGAFCVCFRRIVSFKFLWVLVVGFSCAFTLGGVCLQNPGLCQSKNHLLKKHHPRPNRRRSEKNEKLPKNLRTIPVSPNYRWFLEAFTQKPPAKPPVLGGSRY